MKGHDNCSNGKTRAKQALAQFSCSFSQGNRLLNLCNPGLTPPPDLITLLCLTALPNFQSLIVKNISKKKTWPLISALDARPGEELCCVICWGLHYSTPYSPRGVIQYLGYIGMCREIGYGFWSSQSLKRVSFLPLLATCRIALNCRIQNPNLTFWPKRQVSVKVRFGEGFPRNIHWSALSLYRLRKLYQPKL